MDLFILLPFAISVGLLTACQSPTNSGLSAKVGPFQAGLTSTFAACIIMTIMSLTIGTGDLTNVFEAPAWTLFGGIFGAYAVFIMARFTRDVGAALALALSMLGQLVGGMTIDTFGIGGNPVHIGPIRVIGCVIICVGILHVCMERKYTNISQVIADGKDVVKQSGESKSTNFTDKLIVQMVLIFSVGIASSLRALFNSRLGTYVGPMEAGAISFAIGSLFMLALALITNKGHLSSIKGLKPWQLTGGVYGAISVPIVNTLTPMIGVGAMMTSSMVGMILGGALIDIMGWFGMKKRKINPLRVAGSLIILVGVLLLYAGQ